MAEITVYVPPGSTCEEVLDADYCDKCNGAVYHRCEAPASVAVWHGKDRRAYYMCMACGNHNIRNRGGVDVTLHSRLTKPNLCSKHGHVYVSTCEECNNV